MRLIDADALKIELACLHGSDYQTIHYLNHAPTVDAVQVIRCKDCKHKYIENKVWQCPFGLPGGPDFWCGYGAERKEE